MFGYSSTDFAGPAESLLRFVTAAFLDADFREALSSQPSTALSRFGYEVGRIASLRPPDFPLSLTIDDNILFGPVHWRQWRASDPIFARTEVRLLAAGAKPLVLVHGSEPSLAAVGAWARAHGYAALLSPFQFQPEADATLGNYSNRANVQTPAVANSGHWRGLLISSDTAIAELAWLSLLFGWDSLLGRLLGYPDCCAAAFARNWPHARSEYRGDPGLMWLAIHDARNHILKLPWETNIYARYFGHELIQHFPCTPYCEATRVLAQSNLLALQLYWPAAAEALLAALQAPIMLHDKWSGLFLNGVLAQGATGVRLQYDTPHTLILSGDPALQMALTNGHEAIFQDGHWIVAGQNWTVHALIFERGINFMEERQDALFQ